MADSTRRAPCGFDPYDDNIICYHPARYSVHAGDPSPNGGAHAAIYSCHMHLEDTRAWVEERTRKTASVTPIPTGARA